MMIYSLPLIKEQGFSVLSSNNIKNIGIFGTFVILSTSYFLSANTFFDELSSDTPIKKDISLLKTDKKDLSKIKLSDITKINEAHKNIEVAKVTMDKKSTVTNKAKTTPLSSDEKLSNLLKKYKYIYFDKDGKPTVESKEAIGKLLPILSKLTNISIEVEGHSSSQMYNYLTQKNSEKMAKNLYDYLKSSGVNQKISIIGYGDMYPIIDDKNDDKNSRVEIKIRR